MNYHARMLVLLLAAWPAWAWADCSVLIVGDSLSSGYGLASGKGWVDRLDVRLKQRKPGWRVINSSVAGDTTQNGLQRLPPALKRHRPDTVLIELGGNDALRGTPPAVVRTNLVMLVRQAKAAGARVALLEAPVLPNYGKSYADAVSRLYRDVAASEKVVRVPCFVCGVGVDSGLMQEDGIHPNEKAQGRMLDAVWPHIEPLLVCPRNPA